MRAALFGLTMIAAAAALALFFDANGSPGALPEGPPEPADQSTATVRVERLETAVKDSTRLEIVGTTAPDRRVPLGFQVAGRVARAQVEIGDEVEAGAALAALDKRDFRIALREAEALVSTAKAGVLVAEQSGVSVASRELARTETLREAGGATEAILDRARAQDKAARAQLQQARAELERSLALRDRARAAVTDTVLKAPFNAVVTGRVIQPGQMVGPGAVAFVLEAVDQMRIAASVSSADLTRIDREAPVQVRVEEAGGDVMQGRIRALGWTGDPTTGTFPLEVVVQNADHRLRSGMTAWLSIAVRARPANAGVHAVPLTAVVSRGAEKAVFAVDRSQKQPRAVRIPVSLLGFEHDRAIVEGAFDGFNELITSGQHDLKDRQPIAIRESPQNAGAP